MLLSIIITTRNRIDDLTNCLDSIKKSNLKDTSYEIIIVDDASTDATKDLIPSEFKEFSTIKIIHNTTQKMMVVSRNIGGNFAKGKYLLYIDDDNVIEKDMIFHLISFAERNPTYGMIGPSMYLLHDKKKYLDYQKINFYTSRTTAHVDASSKKYCESDGIPNVFLIRKDAFDKCNGFDDAIVQTYSEPELFFHMRKFGYRCAIVKDAKTYHNVFLESSYTPRNMGASFSQKAYCLMRNRTIVIFRYGSFLNKIIYLLLFSWIWPLIYSLLMLKYKKFNLMVLYWRGFLDGLYFAVSGKIKKFKI